MVHERSARKRFLGVSVALSLFVPGLVFAGPRVLYTDIVTGPNSGGEGGNGIYLSIFGRGFGMNLSQVKVSVGGSEVPRYVYLGASNGRPDVQQLSVQIGPSNPTGAVTVTVGGVPSNTDHSFTVVPGSIYFVSLSGNDSTGAAGDPTRPFRERQHCPGQGESRRLRGRSRRHVVRRRGLLELRVFLPQQGRWSGRSDSPHGLPR